MHTRKQYLDGEVSHQQYYGQFVTESIKRVVVQRIGINRLLASTDPHMNDIPLAEWDSIIGFSDHGSPRISNSLGLSEKFKEAGDCVSASGLTCVMKEAARQVIEEHNG